MKEWGEGGCEEGVWGVGARSASVRRVWGGRVWEGVVGREGVWGGEGV